MQLTRAVDYGVRALTLLARHPFGTRVFLQDLADQAGVPRNYLVKVLKSLAAAQIVRSHRGINGGFSLAREARAINLRQVVEAVDGPVVVMHCLLGPPRNGNSCSVSGQCAVQLRFSHLQDHILVDLEQCNLQDLAAAQASLGDRAAAPAARASEAARA